MVTCVYVCNAWLYMYNVYVLLINILADTDTPYPLFTAVLNSQTIHDNLCMPGVSAAV